jgi:hypothetical protein
MIRGIWRGRRGEFERFGVWVVVEGRALVAEMLVELLFRSASIGRIYIFVVNFDSDSW